VRKKKSKKEERRDMCKENMKDEKGERKKEFKNGKARQRK